MMGTKELAANIAAQFAGTNASSADEVLKVLRESYQILGVEEPEVHPSTEVEAPSPPVSSEPEPQYEEPVMKRQATTRRAAKNPEGWAEPSMDPESAVGHNQITCLVCGKTLKTLMRHIKNAHGLNEMQYKMRFGLREDYPMVAPSLSEKRSQIAKDSGLGERHYVERRGTQETTKKSKEPARA